MPPKHAHQEQNHEELSEEDKKVLEEHHKNHKDPNHPAHEKHPKHGEFLKSVPKRLGGAAIFGAGASAGRAAFQGLGG